MNVQLIEINELIYAENAPVTVSPSLRDKIRLFEGKGASPSDVRTNKLSSSFPLSRSAHLVKERVDSSINNTKKRAPIIPSFPIPVSPLSLTPTIPSSSHPCATLPDGSTLISPRKWNVITVDPESTHHHDSDNNTINNIPQQHNNKGKEKVVKTAEERLPISDSSSDEAQSSRKSSKSSKFSRRPSIEKYEEEVIKLKRMTTEEKEMVKALVKLTTQKVQSFLLTLPLNSFHFIFMLLCIRVYIVMFILFILFVEQNA